MPGNGDAVWGCRWARSGAAKVLKRVLDVAVASVALTALSPVLFAVAVLVWREKSGPVLFRQERAGLRGRTFRIVKFRTMRAARGECEEHARSRVTPLGAALRAWSLDELPELWNVLRGEMSIVGPRPLLPEYVDRYTPEQARRMCMPPGLTGLAQVKGRNALSWEERFAFDVSYVDEWSLWLDLRVILWTVGVVLRRQGVDASDDKTMEPFGGSGPAPR